MTRSPDSAPSPSSNRCSTSLCSQWKPSGQSSYLGRVCRCIGCFPADPTAYRKQEQSVLSSLLAIALIQVGYWFRYRIDPVMPNLVEHLTRPYRAVLVAHRFHLGDRRVLFRIYLAETGI